MELWRWAVVTAVCATISTTLALYLHRDDPACVTVPVRLPAPSLLEVPVPVPVPVPAPSVMRVRELVFDATAYPQIEIAGTLERGVRWLDARGDNVLVFSEVKTSAPVETSVLHAAHHVVTATGVRHVRTIKQRTQCEDGDLLSAFAAGYRVTDLDDDGIGELMFGLFHGACPTDVSAGKFKLFLVEDGVKYVLRGWGYYGDAHSAMEPTSRDVAGAPEVLVQHLDTYWPWLSDQAKSQLHL